MSGMPKALADGYLVQSVDEAMLLLELLATRDNMSLQQLASQLVVSKTTIYRLLSTLERRDFVEQSPGTRKYQIGPKAFEVGSRYLRRIGLGLEIQPVLQELRRQTHETINVAILRDGQVIYVNKVESEQTLRADLYVGRRVFAHCTALGKVLLAWLDPADVDAVVAQHGLPRLTPQTIDSRSRLDQELAEVRKLGYALDDEEHIVGILCIAAPIRDYSGRVVAAVSMAGPSARLSRGQLVEMGNLIVTAGKLISTQFGHFSVASAQSGK